MQVDDIFAFTSDVAIAEKRLFEVAFTKITGDSEYMETFANIPDNELKNVIANNLLFYHASSQVLYNLDELLDSAAIATSLRPTFMQYYHGVVSGNMESILTEDVPCKYDFTEFPIRDSLFRAAMFDYANYLAKVREIAANQTFEILDGLSKHNSENITKVMSELYSYLSSRRFQVDFEDQQLECTRLCKEYKVADIYKSFQIVINCFDLFPFKYKKFQDVIKIKVNDPGFDDIEIQRRYLISTVRKDSNYDRIVAQINAICNEYSETMSKIENEIANDEERVRKLYSGYDGDIDEYLNNLNI